jgi:hypothetical protein
MGVTISWFIGILTEKEGMPDEWETNGRVYRIFRTPDAVFLKDTRGGSHVSVVGFSLREIPNVLAELQQIMAEEFAKEE